MVYLQPYSISEFQLLVSKLSDKEKKGLTPSQIELFTGRVPREMKFFAEALSVAHFERSQRIRFDINIKYTFDTLNDSEKTTFIQNLHDVFGLSKTPTSLVRVNEKVMDAGFLYFDDEKEEYKTLSNIASKSLMQFLMEIVHENYRRQLCKMGTMQKIK